MNIINNYPWILKPSFIDSIEATYWKEALVNKIKWYQPKIKVYSKIYPVPRLTYFLGEKGISYKYSGLEHLGNGWPKWFMPLLTRIQVNCNVSFNGCLLNLYRNGNDRMGWHADNEKEIDSTKDFYLIK